MLVISALFFYTSLIAFVYHLLVLVRLVSVGVAGRPNTSFTAYLMRALFFRETSLKVRQYVKGLWLSTSFLLAMFVLLLVSQLSLI